MWRTRTTELAVAVAIFAIASWARLRDLDAAIVLSDQLGPWLRALANPVNPAPHAAPYGWALHPPYALCLIVADSLRSAVAAMLLLQALVAPLATRGVRPLAGLVAGLLVALDGGLVDTALAGSEGYLGALWVGAALAFRPVAPLCLALGAMNHPLVLCCVPLLALCDWRSRSVQISAVLGLLALLPTLPRWLSGAEIGVGLDPLLALPAWLEQGGPAAWVLLLGPLVALWKKRRLALATLASMTLLLLAGLWLGYLRDHHLRLLTVPLALCAASLPRRWVLLPLLALRLPVSQVPESDKPHRPGTLGLATEIADEISSWPQPVFVEGVIFEGTAAAEASTLLLDLHLRGVPVALGASEGAIITHERRSGRRWTLEQQPDWSVLCAGRVGGSWDAMAVLVPSTTLEDLARCP